MPTNFDLAANQLRNRATEQFQPPPPMAAAPPAPVATPEVPMAPPAAVAPPAMDPGGIVPVNRPPMAAQLPSRVQDRLNNMPPTNFGGGGIVPVDRQQIMDRLPPDRQQAVREVLGNPRGREAAAKVGGAVMGRAAADAKRAEAMQRAAAARAAMQARMQAAQAEMQARIQAAQAARGQRGGGQIDRQQRLQDFISNRALPGDLATRLPGLLGG